MKKDKKNNSADHLAYLNEDDRAYGLAGMAVSVAALDAFDSIVEFSLDAENQMVSFAGEYYFTGAQTISPKATWNNLLNNFYLTSTMVISNLMARSLVREKKNVPESGLKAIHHEMLIEGEEACGLESDEVDEIYDRAFKRMNRIFSNPRIHPAIDDLARVFARRRTLSGREIFEELRILQIL
ncbi:MAG: hypothetical protein HDS70_00540 [Bacteroidales bacterium]|nr:hypothetical protein [Bacteroidales bacterium]MBD5212356.1 hypothetical protein [Bacteroidales bacterium]MBD5217883.1 hypothetical protein [Bacteroidales bacterium]MBD5220846.1 hypothetical protein [Bacteroidales bacterium]